MKKLFLLAVVALISVTSFAQDGKWAAGLNIGYGTDEYIKKPSIGIKVLYDITDQWTVAPSFDYYFQKKIKEEGAEIKMNVWDINCDLHWNVLRKENFKLYPFAGITYLHAKATAKGYGQTGSNSNGDFGVNIGVGGQVNIASNWAASLEAKYESAEGQFIPSLAILYKF
ncbi:porin family protein [Phocaeicola sp.]